MDASAGIGSISPTSRFVRDAVAARVEATRAKDVETLATPLGATCVEFDDVRYAVTSVADERGGRVRVDVSVGAPGGAFEERRAMEDAATLICLSDGTIAANEKANAGYDATFRVDVTAIASLEDEERREEILQRVSRCEMRCTGRNCADTCESWRRRAERKARSTGRLDEEGRRCS